MNLNRKTFIKSLLNVVGFTAIFSVALATNNLPNVKFEIAKIQNPLGLMNINETIGQVNDWKNQIENDDTIIEDDKSLTKEQFVKGIRYQFGRLGISFPIKDSELLIKYQASTTIPLVEADYYETLYGKDGLKERIDRVKKNPEDVEAARTIFGILKDGKIDAKEQAIVDNLKGTFINLKFQSLLRAQVIGDVLNDPEYKDIVDVHKKEYNIGNKESEKVKINMLDGSKQRTLFTDILAIGALVGPLPKEEP